MSFDNIIGNEKIKNFLDKSIKEKHISHSYMFTGIDGIGKTLFAKEFARKLLCFDNEESEDCSSCIKFKTENHPDFKLIEPDSGSIKIEQIRDMQDDIVQKPIISEKKVYVIRDSEYMTREAQNCLLKTLEEPPEFAIIILVTANESKLLTTVKSRCMKIAFDEIDKDEIKKYILSNYTDIDERLFDMCDGSIGKEIELQENKEIYIGINKLIDNLDKQDLIYILNNADVLYKQKDNINKILNYINNYLYSLNKFNCIKYVEDTKRRLTTNSNYEMTIDYLLIRMWEEINEKYSRSSI